MNATPRVLVVSDLEQTGGAATAATRLIDGLSAHGVEVSRLVGRLEHRAHYRRPPPVGELVPAPERLPRGVRGLSYRFAPRAWRAATARSITEQVRAWRREHPFDVINLHNLHAQRGWGPGVVEGLTRIAPVVWTLHDMWAFTGRCAHSFDCEKFRARCDASCPTADVYPALHPRDIEPAHRRKQALFRGGALHAVTPSAWLRGQALAAGWPSSRVHQVHNGVDLARFAPGDRAELKRKLAVDPDVPLLVAVTFVHWNPFKGMRILQDALRRSRTRPLALVTLGSHPLNLEVAGVSYRHLGYVRDDAALARVYGAADACVLPSLAENQPNTLVEAMACGCPLVGFPRGGIPELIQAGQTGVLATDVNAAALATAIDALLDDPPAPETVRTAAEAHHDLETQAGRVLDVLRAAAG